MAPDGTNNQRFDSPGRALGRFVLCAQVPPGSARRRRRHERGDDRQGGTPWSVPSKPDITFQAQEPPTGRIYGHRNRIDRKPFA
jgi:hypothetical protein